MYKSIVLATLLLLAAGLPAFAGWDEGVAAFTSKNFSAAAHEFQGVVDQDPEGYRGHYMLGLSLEQMNRKEEALNHLRKAYDLNPNDLSTKMALGRAYKNLRRYGDAAKLLGSVDPSTLPAKQQAAFYQIRGESRFRSGNSGAAVGDFKQLAKLRPDDPQVQYLYGTTALKEGQLDTAITALGKAAGSGDADMQRGYVQALIRKGRTSNDRATKKQSYLKAAGIAKSLAAKSSTYDNLILQVSAELGAGLYAEAVKSGQAAIAKKSTDWIAHYYLGQAYTSNGDYGQAEAPLKQAMSLAKAPNDVRNVWKQLGFTYEKQKKYSESIDAYQNAGDTAGVARVKKNEETERFNTDVEAENARIKALEEERKKLEAEMEKLEGGGL